MTRSRKQLLLKLGVFLLLGAIVNVALAWGCACFCSTDQRTELGAHSWNIEVPSYWRSSAIFGWLSIGTGIRVQESRAYFAGPQFDNPPLYGAICFHVGVPARSMKWSLRDEAIGGTLDFWPDGTFGFWSSGLEPFTVRDDQWRFQRRLPMKPIWPGLTINTIFYAAMLWLLWIARRTPGKIRRFIRVSRGRCPACGYQIAEGVGPRCSECGHALGRVAD